MNLLWPSRITSTLSSHTRDSTQTLAISCLTQLIWTLWPDNAPSLLGWLLRANKNYNSANLKGRVLLTWRRAKLAPWCWEQWGIPRSWGNLGTRHPDHCRHTDTRPETRSPHTRRSDQWPDLQLSGSAVQRSMGRHRMIKKKKISPVNCSHRQTHEMQHCHK